MNITELTSKVEEVSRAYTSRYGIERDSDWFVLKLQEELGELIQTYLMMIGKARTKGKTPDELKQGLEEEIADVLGHVLLLANHYGVDMDSAMKKKWLVWTEGKL